MPRPRPTEVRAIAALLQEEHPDADALSAAIIEKLDAMRSERDHFTVVSVWDGLSWANGLYGTATQASRKAQTPLEGLRTGVLRIAPPRTDSEAVKGTCQGCRHPSAAHNFPRSKVGGCVVGLPLQDGRPSRHPRCECEELT